MPIAAGLEDTTHTATFTSIDSARVVVDGLIVTSRRGTFQQGLVSLVVLGGGVLAVGAAVVLGRSGQGLPEGSEYSRSPRAIMAPPSKNELV